MKKGATTGKGRGSGRKSSDVSSKGTEITGEDSQ